VSSGVENDPTFWGSSSGPFCSNQDELVEKKEGFEDCSKTEFNGQTCAF
jgi:hypothetical protein